jgi:hypothetical protein
MQMSCPSDLYLTYSPLQLLIHYPPAPIPDGQIVLIQESWSLDHARVIGLD